MEGPLKECVIQRLYASWFVLQLTSVLHFCSSFSSFPKAVYPCTHALKKHIGESCCWACYLSLTSEGPKLLIRASFRTSVPVDPGARSGALRPHGCSTTSRSTGIMRHAPKQIVRCIDPLSLKGHSFIIHVNYQNIYHKRPVLQYRITFVRSSKVCASGRKHHWKHQENRCQELHVRNLVR